ncbi:MAG: 1-acyl-sn-glycerol-3-phosphate acyltransferase, partial [Polyangia bacterium]
MVRKVNAWVRPQRDRYFRSEISGLEHIPDDEPSMLVGNHDGGYLFPDAICMGSFYYSALGTEGRRLYALMHDFPFRIAPSLTNWLQRCGVIPASRRNGEKVLQAGHHILVYPGGSFEAFRKFSDRRHLSLG